MGALEFIISIKDKASSGIDKIAKEFGKANTKFKDLKKNSDVLASSIDSLRAKSSSLVIARNASTSISEIRKLNGELTKTEKELHKLENLPPKSFLDRMKQMGSGMLGTLGMGFGVYKVMDMVKAGVEKAHELHQAQAQLKNTMQNMGTYSEAAYAKASAGAKKLASGIKFSTAEVTGLQSQLRMVGNISEHEMQRMVMASADMAAKYGMDLNDAGNTIAKAVNNPEMMRRLGMQLKIDPKAVSHIQKLAKGGQEAAARLELLDIIQQKVGGAAKAAFDADPVARYNKAIGSIRIQMGEVAIMVQEKLAPAFEAAANGIKSLFAWMSKHKEVMIPLGVTIGVFTLGLLGYSVIQRVAAYATKSLTKEIIKQNIAAAMNPYVLIALAVIGLITWLVYLYNTSEKVRGFFSGLVGGFKAMIDGFKQWISGVWEGVKQIASGIWQIIKNIFAPVINYYKFLWSIISWVWEKISGFFSGMWDSTTSIFGSMIGWIKEKFKALVEFLKGVFKPIVDFFDTLFQPLIDGIKNAFGWIRDNVIAPLEKAGGWVLQKLGIDIKGISAGFKDIGKGASTIGETSKMYGHVIAKGYEKGAEAGIKALQKEKADKKKAEEAGVVLVIGGDDKANNQSTAEAVASGGTRNTSINIHLGKMIENIIFQGGFKENAQDMERQIEESLIRVLYSAQSAS